MHLPASLSRAIDGKLITGPFLTCPSGLVGGAKLEDSEESALVRYPRGCKGICRIASIGQIVRNSRWSRAVHVQTKLTEEWQRKIVTKEKLDVSHMTVDTMIWEPSRPPSHPLPPAVLPRRRIEGGRRLPVDRKSTHTSTTLAQRPKNFALRPFRTHRSIQEIRTIRMTHAEPTLNACIRSKQANPKYEKRNNA